jgi:hypothetical protein
LPGSPDYAAARDLLRNDTEARRKLAALALNENAAPRDASEAVSFLTDEPQGSLRPFYLEKLRALSKVSRRTNLDGAQAADLLGSLALTGDASDASAITDGIAWLVDPKTPFELHERSTWRLMVATIASAERGGAAGKRAVSLVRAFAEKARRPSGLGPWPAQLLFAAEYARRLEGGRSTADALRDLYGASPEYLVRVPAMNALEALGDLRLTDQQLRDAFPFRSAWERDRYVQEVFSWMLENVGSGYGAVAPQLVTLADGRQPSGPLHGDDLKREVAAMRARLERETAWPTSTAKSIRTSQPLTPLFTRPELAKGTILRDRRLERPIVGGPL